MTKKKRSTPPWMRPVKPYHFDKMVHKCPYIWDRLIAYIPPAMPWEEDPESEYGKWRAEFIEWLKNVPKVKADEEEEEEKTECNGCAMFFPFVPMNKKGTPRPFGWVTPEKVSEIVRVFFTEPDED